MGHDRPERCQWEAARVCEGSQRAYRASWVWTRSATATHQGLTPPLGKPMKPNDHQLPWRRRCLGRLTEAFGTPLVRRLWTKGEAFRPRSRAAGACLGHTMPSQLAALLPRGTPETLINIGGPPETPGRPCSRSGIFTGKHPDSRTSFPDPRKWSLCTCVSYNQSPPSTTSFLPPISPSFLRFSFQRCSFWQVDLE
jgi:hypothetical protein